MTLSYNWRCNSWINVLLCKASQFRRSRSLQRIEVQIYVWEYLLCLSTWRLSRRLAANSANRANRAKLANRANSAKLANGANRAKWVQPMGTVFPWGGRWRFGCYVFPTIFLANFGGLWNLFRLLCCLSLHFITLVSWAVTPILPNPPQMLPFLFLYIFLISSPCKALGDFWFEKH